MNPSTFVEHKMALLEELTMRRQLALDVQEVHGIDTSAIVQKIDAHASALASRRFSVVVFGAFSDGKTTVISALTKRLGLPIGRAPTTDRLAVYEYGDVRLVDVPGLFSEQERHDAVTRGYVSEANLLLLVLDAVNPLKSSHQEAVKWLLVDLGKAESAIFVLNKMDDVADLEDSDEFTSMAATKIGVVRSELKRIGLHDGASLPIVCVAADPDGKGLDHWLVAEEEYERLSRMRALRAAVDERVRKEREELEVTAGMAGVREAARLLGAALSELRASLERENELARAQHAEVRKRLEGLERQLARVQRLIREEALALKKQLRNALEGAGNLQSLRTVVVSRIGAEGEVLAEELSLLVQKHTEDITIAQLAFAEDLEQSASFFDSHFRRVGQAFAKMGGNVGKVPARQIADALIKARDVLKLPVKFKPWQALKWGKWLKGGGKFLGALGPIIDTVESLINVGVHVLLEKRKQAAQKAVDELFAQFEASLEPDSFEEEYFPAIDEARNVVAAAAASVAAADACLEQLVAHERSLAG